MIKSQIYNLRKITGEFGWNKEGKPLAYEMFIIKNPQGLEMIPMYKDRLIHFLRTEAIGIGKVQATKIVEQLTIFGSFHEIQFGKKPYFEAYAWHSDVESFDYEGSEKDGCWYDGELYTKQA